MGLIDIVKENCQEIYTGSRWVSGTVAVVGSVLGGIGLATGNYDLMELGTYITLPTAGYYLGTAISNLVKE